MSRPVLLLIGLCARQASGQPSIRGCACLLEECCTHVIDFEERPPKKGGSCAFLWAQPELYDMDEICAEVESGARDGEQYVCDMDEIKEGPLTRMVTFQPDLTGGFACSQPDRNLCAFGPEDPFGRGYEYILDKLEIDLSPAPGDAVDCVWGCGGKPPRDWPSVPPYTGKYCVSNLLFCNAKERALPMNILFDSSNQSGWPFTDLPPYPLVDEELCPIPNGQTGPNFFWKPSAPDARCGTARNEVCGDPGKYGMCYEMRNPEQLEYVTGSVTITVVGEWPCEAEPTSAPTPFPSLPPLSDGAVAATVPLLGSSSSRSSSSRSPRKDTYVYAPLPK
jgi:hypothetical protein